jgi:outer membrane PBP1 activator LpoA protein
MENVKTAIWTILSGVAFGLCLSGCKPDGPPPDLVKTQREALNKAKALEGQMQQQADERMKAIDDAQK